MSVSFMDSAQSDEVHRPPVAEREHRSVVKIKKLGSSFLSYIYDIKLIWHSHGKLASKEIDDRSQHIPACTLS